jgi:hypothetical protein
MSALSYAALLTEFPGRGDWLQSVKVHLVHQSAKVHFVQEFPYG